MGQFRLLQCSRFLPIFGTQFLGALNDNVFKNALVVWLVFSFADASGEGNILVFVAAGIFILPFFFFSLTAGQLADKFEKSGLIRRIKAAEFVIMLVAAVGWYFNSLWLLLAVLFCMGAQSTLFGPLKYSILPQHLSADELLGGNGMVQMATYLAILLGTIIGGLLMAAGSEGSVYITAVIIFLALAGWLFSCFIPEAAPPEPGLKINWNFATSLNELITYTREDKTVFWAVIGVSWFWFYGASCLSLIPGYAHDVLNADANISTLMLAAVSIGIGGGSLLCARLSCQQAPLGLVAVGALGMSCFAIAIIFISPADLSLPSAGLLTVDIFFRQAGCWWVLFSLVMIGISGGLYIVPLYVLVQTRTDKRHCARVIAFNNIMNAFFMVVSAILLILLAWLGLNIPQLFLTIGLISAVAVGFIFTNEAEFPGDFFRYIQRLRT